MFALIENKYLQNDLYWIVLDIEHAYIFAFFKDAYTHIDSLTKTAVTPNSTSTISSGGRKLTCIYFLESYVRFPHKMYAVLTQLSNDTIHNLMQVIWFNCIYITFEISGVTPFFF